MAVIANSVSFVAAAPKRTLSNLTGQAAGIIRLWVLTGASGVKIGDDATLTTANGLPIVPNELNYFEFAAASAAGTSVSLVRENVGAPILIHLMSEV
jgi:hypothetical protein